MQCLQGTWRREDGARGSIDDGSKLNKRNKKQSHLGIVVIIMIFSEYCLFFGSGKLLCREIMMLFLDGKKKKKSNKKRPGTITAAMMEVTRRTTITTAAVVIVTSKQGGLIRYLLMIRI